MEKIRFYSILMLISSFLLTSKAYSQSCPTGLISYWKMDETSGLKLIDQAGGHDAMCNRAPGTDPNGKIGAAHFFIADFDSGVTSTVSNSTDYNFPANSSFTILYWIRITAGDLNSREQVIISRGNFHNGSPTGAFWSCGIGVNGNLVFLLQDSDLNHAEIQTPLGYADGNWHQVACVRNENNSTNTIFVDGIESVKSTKDYSASFSSTEPVQFCQLKNSGDDSDSFGFFYNGSLDEVAIIKTAFNSTDLSDQIILANSDVGLCDGLNPNIISTPDIKAIVGSPYVYKVHAGGLQNGMSYSLISGPEGMVIDSLSGLLSWTPLDITTQALVKVCAKNNISPADTQTFRIYLGNGTSCPDDLFVLLKLDENSGPVYSDFYVLHNAEASVSPVATEGIIGGAQLFNDKTKMEIPDVASEFDWSKDASFSYEYWLKTSSPQIMICMARHRLDSQHTAYMATGTDSTGKARFELRDNKGILIISKGTTMISDGNWHHIVNVRNGETKENIIYVDGIAESIQSITFDSSFNAESPTPISIGYLIREFEYEPSYHFLGSIDEIVIYNRAITSDEVLNFYNQSQPISHCGEGNFAPVITSLPDSVASLNNQYTYILTAEDIDMADVLTLSAIDKPQWLTFTWQPGEKTASLSGIPASAGQYTALLRVSDSYVDIDQEFTIVVSDGVPTLMNDLESEGILIYPIPARDQLIIFIKDPKSKTQLEIINEEGKVLRQAIMNTDSEKQVFGLNDMANGTYFLHVQNDRVNKTQRFIIAR